MIILKLVQMFSITKASPKRGSVYLIFILQEEREIPVSLVGKKNQATPGKVTAKGHNSNAGMRLSHTITGCFPYQQDKLGE